MQRLRTRATTDGAAVARLTALHRRLLAGAAATVMVWAAAPAERPAHAAEVPADDGDTTLRLERLSDLPTTVRLAVGKARLVETGRPAVLGRDQGWTFANDGLVLSEGDGVRMAGDRVENSAGAVILGRRGVVLGGDDATGTLSVDNAGTVLGAGGPGVRITGEAARLVNRTDALIGGIGGRAAVLRGGETSVDNQGRITSSSHVGLKMTADDDALLENGQTGLIIGTGRGAVVDGRAVTVVNDGAIAGARADDDQNGAARDALGLLARGDQVVVVNRATGLVVGDDQGLRVLSDQGALIDNAGVIGGLDGDGGDGTIRLVNRDTGVVTGGNGTVLAGAAVEIDNAGAFLAPDSRISQPILSVFDSDETRIINRLGGVIDGSSIGIDVTGGDVELINDGFIRSGIQDDSGLGGLDIGVLITDAEDVLIENDGRIEGAYGIAVFTADEVEITNDSAGEIHAGYGNAVAVEADIVRVGNEGLIQSVFETGVEVVAGASGLVENTGVILGGETGVFGAADVMTVHNQGVITAGHEDDDDQDPVAVDLTGGAVRLVNDHGGVVSGDTGALLYGVDRAAIDNAGIISGGEMGLIIQGGTAGIVNTGRIEGAAGAGIVSVATGTTSIVNAGIITGAVAGVAADGMIAIDNAGTISAGGTAISATGGTVTNHAGGEIAGAVGISARGDDVGIVNAGGLIRGDQVAIAVEGDATLVDNAAGAEITAQGDTIDLKGEALIVNAGTIRSTGAVAIIVEGDALVDNAEGGVIEAAGPAMILAGVTSLTNAGRISSTDPTFDGDDDDGVAVLAGSGGLIVNTGVIDSGAGAVSIGDVDTVTGPAELETVIANDGLILAHGNGAALGADVEGAVAVANSSTIAAEDGPAVDLVAADILLGNGGTIASEGGTGASLAADIVSVSNAAGALIGGGDIGLAIQGGRVDVANGGVIAGAAIGLAVGGDVVTVDNQGEISGETGVVLREAPDGEGDGVASELTLVNRGTIDGGVVFQGGDSNFADIGGTVAADEAGRAVVFADGAGTRDLIVETGAAIGGDILAGTDNTLEQARLRQDSVARFSGAGRFEHDLQGFGLIDKTGAGTWRLDGDLLAAAFDITGGGVALNGRYTGDRLSVGGAGTLSGTGRITGELINAGTVAPGNSIGTLTVTADYTQTGTGTLAMEYADDGAGGALTDRLVVSGAADIQGGTLALTSFDGSTPRYASAELLTAAGGVTGGFDRVETDRAGLLGGVLIEGDVISLRLVDTANGFRALAETETARGVAGVLEVQALTAAGDRDVLLTRLAALDDAGVAAALGDLAGTEYAGHWRYLRSTGRAFVDGATQAGAAGHRGAWITGFGNAGRTSGEDAAGDVRWRSAGTTVGIDFAVGEDARLGLAAGVTDGRMSARDRDAGIDTTGWHIGAYGAVPAGPVMLDAAVAFTRASSDASRSISGIGRTASGSFDTDQITASVGVSTDIVVPGAKPGTPEAAAGAPAWTVTPMLRLTFDHQRSDDVTETGAGAASLRVEGATVQGLEAFAGLRFGASFGDAAAGDVVVRPSFTLGIGQELLDRDNSLMASFADDPANRFKVNGVSQGRTTGRFGAEVAVDVAAGVTIGAAYAGSIDETGDDHRLTAGLRLSW